MATFILSPVIKAAAAYVSVVNAVHVGLLKKTGILKSGVLQIQETLGSLESFNRRQDLNSNVSFLFHLVGEADLKGFFDPTNEDAFLSWTLTPESYVTLPGLIENGPIEHGQIRFLSPASVDYLFEFTGNDGKKYRYTGRKILFGINPVAAWTTVKGNIVSLESAAVMLQSTVFSNQKPSLSSIVPFLKNLKIR